MKISICTVTARRGFLDLNAKMLARQTYRNFEWVIVDSFYEERSKLMWSLKKELGLEITHVPNIRDNTIMFRDICRNRNKALMLANGDAIIFLDDYAVFGDSFIDNHYRVLINEDISVGMMQDLAEPINEDIIKHALDIDYFRGGYSLTKDARDLKDGSIQSVTPYSFTYTGNLGIPRKVFETLNGFDPRMEGFLEDCDFGVRATNAYFKQVFNPYANTVNLYAKNIPYAINFDHEHDIEPFVSNQNNSYKGNPFLSENEFIKIAFMDKYRVGTCKICGATGIIDPHDLLFFNRDNKVVSVPEGLLGGLDTLRNING